VVAAPPVIEQGVPRLALAGDTMLGRGVGERLRHEPVTARVAPEVLELVRDADLFVLNLEGGISDTGEPWPASHRHWFRAPPEAVDLLATLGVDCVTLANNHALDYGSDALLDTVERLRAVGIETAGAGADRRRARAPVWLRHDGFELAVLAFCDHEYQTGAGWRTPGTAFADLAKGVPRWVTVAVRDAAPRSDALLVSPHWGPNWTVAPPDPVRRAARQLVDAGATLVAGHSAHVFHGVEGRVLYDLGDLLDDFAVDDTTEPNRRTDRSLLWFVEIDRDGPTRLEAVPVTIRGCRTELAPGADAAWISSRFRSACADLGTDVREEEGRLVVTW